MPLLLLASCAYTLVDYTVPSLPDTYMTEPQARDLYCEVGYSYAEGFTIDEAKLRLHKAVREGKAGAIVDLKYGTLSLPGGYAMDGKPLQTVYTASGVLITWGPCR